MQRTTKDFIKRRILNILIITVLSFIGVITYLGLHRDQIDPDEKFEVIVVNPEEMNK